jgi:phosphoserine aminotransferase
MFAGFRARARVIQLTRDAESPMKRAGHVPPTGCAHSERNGTMTAKPAQRPLRPHFSSGPCAKRPGWTPEALNQALVGRSHRSKPGKAKLEQAIERTRKLLGVPADYRIAIVPASDTGAVEIALWSILGPKPVDVLVWESFGNDWATDITKQLKLPNVRVLKAGYGDLPDLAQVNPAHDVIFTWNGTTSGVRVPDGAWISDTREGVTICDATSAAFAQDLPWTKLDVVTFSWQKVLGGEAAHGILVLSPRAVVRIENNKPAWPLPKIFRMTKDGKLNEGIFKGETINTPSMLCVEDYLDALTWAESVGGLTGLMARADENLHVIDRWTKTSGWCDFLARNPRTRSNTSVCLKIVDPWFTAKDADGQAAAAKKIADLLDKEGVAFDIAAYRDAPPGLRIWAGATVESADMKALMPWLDWAWSQVKAS